MITISDLERMELHAYSGEGVLTAYSGEGLLTAREGTVLMFSYLSNSEYSRYEYFSIEYFSIISELRSKYDVKVWELNPHALIEDYISVSYYLTDSTYSVYISDIMEGITR